MPVFLQPTGADLQLQPGRAGHGRGGEEEREGEQEELQ